MRLADSQEKAAATHRIGHAKLNHVRANRIQLPYCLFGGSQVRIPSAQEGDERNPGRRNTNDINYAIQFIPDDASRQPRC